MKMKHIKYILPAILLASGATAFVSCDDMLDMGNENILYVDDNTLTSANDTVNTYLGILLQLQKVGVRTNLFGELRGDLVDVNSNANSYLKEIADFNVSDENPYNNPRDYYAIINNCNYFLAKADTTLSESRYQNGAAQAYFVLRAEALAVRSIRAWLYLQLGQIYGDNIPVVKSPILSFDDAENYMENAPKMNLQQICQEFIDDLEPYRTWAAEYLYPYHGNPGRSGYNGSMPSRMSVLPIQLVLGDLYLWKASIEQNPDLAFQAAKYYYDYIIWTPNAQGATVNNSSYKVVNATSYYRDHWSFNSGNFTTTSYPRNYESYWYRTSVGSFGGPGDEVISAIAMDSVATEGHYNELTYLYCTNELTQSAASLTPSKPCINYSTKQSYGEIYQSAGATDPEFVELKSEVISESQRQQYYDGDVRLGCCIDRFNYDKKEFQSISKFGYSGISNGNIVTSATTRDVILYRTGDVYLRLAEALNFAGQKYPACHKFAYYILSLGLDQYVMDDLVKPLCNKSDSLAISYFKFNDRTIFRTQLSDETTENHPDYQYFSSESDFENAITQIGIHQRGSGSPFINPTYYPQDAEPNTSLASYPEQPAEYVAVSGTGTTLLKNLQAKNPTLVDSLSTREGIEIPVKTTEMTVTDFNVLADTYNSQMMSFSALYQTRWKLREKAWYIEQTTQLSDRQYEVVDSLLNIESALETCFEGFRFGYLMRDSYRHNDPTILANRVGERNSSLVGTLSDRNNWFISWKGLIGK